jgi:hypothetical protein
MDVPDPRGQTTKVEVRFDELSWSPFGRYTLATVSPITSEVYWRVVIDMERPRLAEVPGTFEFRQKGATLRWMPDGTLLAAHPSDPEEDQPARLEHWQILPTRDSLLGFINEYVLKPQDLPGLESTGATSAWLILWPVSIDAKTVAFELQAQEGTAKSILASFNFKYSLLRRLNQVPSEASQVIFAPDLAGAIILGDGKRIYFAPADGRQPYDLAPILGDQAEAFTWLPPAPLKP